MIKTTEKAARKLGEDLATELHAQTSIELRSGVLAARGVILYNLEYKTQTAFYAGFDSKMDELEPLSLPR